jgi:hypothetical protein
LAGQVVPNRNQPLDWWVLLNLVESPRRKERQELNDSRSAIQTWFFEDCSRRLDHVLTSRSWRPWRFALTVNHALYH